MEGLYESAFEALLRGSDDLVLVVDRECRILDAGELARSRLSGGERLAGGSFLDHLSVNSGRALRAFLDALGTDGAITLDHLADEGGVGDVRRVRYAVHAIPRAGLRRDFLLVGRELPGPAVDPGRPDPVAVDPLTGLANRSGMSAGLERLWAVCEGDPSRPLAWVLMVDVDRFKDLNDTYGHVAGDAVLADVGRVLGTSIREGDLAARYGGDEFLLAGRASDRSDVERIAGRILEAVRGLEPQPPGVASPIRVTASVGAVLAAPGPQCAVRDAIAAADRCLYRAKDSGRDRAVVEPQGFGP